MEDTDCRCGSYYHKPKLDSRYAQKGYGHVINCRHQFRGRVVCRKYKNAFSTYSGYGSSSFSSSPFFSSSSSSACSSTDDISSRLVGKSTKATPGGEAKAAVSPLWASASRVRRSLSTTSATIARHPSAIDHPILIIAYLVVTVGSTDDQHSRIRHATTYKPSTTARIAYWRSLDCRQLNIS